METQQRKQISLAQNFLRSPKLVRRLVRMSKIGLSDTVYEIGPGNGIITAALASVAGQVIAIEKDPELVRRLRERFRPVENVQIVEKDFLNYSFRIRPAIGVPSLPVGRQTRVSEYKLFASIPYNSTAQIVRKILHEILLQLKRTDFWPVPNVDSVLLSIKRRARPLVEGQDVALYREFVQYGFGRWKPNLKLAFKNVFTYKQWKRLARDLNFPLNATPTELSVEQWLGLYHGFRYRRRHDDS
jgi:23S rRNA (adenine-N6)-dimethyltransferase